MLSTLLALAALVAGLSLGAVLHRGLFRIAGQRRAGRFAAYVVGGACWGLAAGAVLGLAKGGWHRARGAGQAFHVPLPDGLVLGLAFGVLLGAIYFVQSERRGGGAFLADQPRLAEFPTDYVQALLAAEAQSTARERANLARYLARRARRSGQPLPPELVAFVARNTSRRRLTGR